MAPIGALVPVPDVIDVRAAASVMRVVLAASHFATDLYLAQPDVAFVHAEADRLSLLLTQIVNLRGGEVIGRCHRTRKWLRRKRPAPIT